MACGSCNRARLAPLKVKTPPKQASTKASTVVNSQGKTLSIMQSLIERPGQPSGGWTFSVEIGGQTIPVQGRNAQDAFEKVRGLYTSNNVPWTERDIWLNLNLYWLSRTPAKYHKVSLRDLNVIVDQPEAEKKPQPGKRAYTPKDWGRYGWHWLGMWLARDSYRFDEFLRECKNVLHLLDPVKNPSIGCVECYREFALAVHEMEGNPPVTIEEARHWLHDIHNSVNVRTGKSVLVFAKAAKANFWV